MSAGLDQELVERLMRYARIDTTSNEVHTTTPSDLCILLAKRWSNERRRAPGTRASC
jgi:hypothetical protein